jgi:hypothetical protein
MSSFAWSVVGLSTVAIAGLSGCGPHQVVSLHGSPVAASQDTAKQHRLTRPEIRKADAAARRELASEPATVQSASATASRGVLLQSNTGTPCRSGWLLHVKLIGRFPHIVTTGLPSNGGQANRSTVVHAVLLTADAATGRTCLLSVETGAVRPSPGATVLHLG